MTRRKSSKSEGIDVPAARKHVSIRPVRMRAEVIWQCLECGAPSDRRYGVGEESWCPHCQRGGTVMGEEGKFPLPHLYDHWRRTQERQRPGRRDHTENPVDSSQTKGSSRLQLIKTHSGTFHCPQCWIELQLFGQQSLKCEFCRGLLKRGGLASMS
jgi:hypothetical protein